MDLGGGRRDKERRDHLLHMERLAAQLQALVETLESQKDLTAQRNALKQEISDMTVQKSQIEERYARERREVEHKVGLLKTGQEQDLAAAKRETALDVREGNLERERTQFAKEMAFQREFFEKQSEQLQELMRQVLERLPSVEALVRVGQGSVDPGE
jgi:hypothetical protein